MAGKRSPPQLPPTVSETELWVAQESASQGVESSRLAFGSLAKEPAQELRLMLGRGHIRRPNPIPEGFKPRFVSCRGSVVLMDEAAESVTTLDLACARLSVGAG
jgi:hypothetical protein